MPSLAEVSEILSQIVFLLELKGENVFKIRAFHNAIRILQNTSTPGAEFIEQAKAGKIKGIGAGLAQVIEEVLLGGESATLKELKAEFPDTLFELFRLPGLGPKRIKLLYEKLKIQSLADLKASMEAGKLSELQGFGPKLIDSLSAALSQQESYGNKHLLSKGITWANQIVAHLNPVVKNIELSGELRRGEEIIASIELIALADNPDIAMRRLLEFPQIKSGSKLEDNVVSLVLEDNIEVKVYFVSEKDFVLKLLITTGTKAHLEKLRSLATTNKTPIFTQSFKRESDIYNALKLAYVPAELRDGDEEFRKPIPELIELKDILGVVHAHSTYSDGRESLATLAQEIKIQGFQYLGISDHSQSAAYAGGLKADDILRQHDEIEQLNAKLAPFRIFKGIESDILKDGALDYPTRILESFDFIIASVHSNFKISKEDMTERLVRAIQNPYTTILGHCTGRLLLERAGYEFDFERVLEEASKRNVVIEINANPRRLDIAWERQRQAKNLGLKFCIGPDAHSLKGVGDLKFGVSAARKGWLTKHDNLSSLSKDQLESYFLNRKKKLV